MQSCVTGAARDSEVGNDYFRADMECTHDIVSRRDGGMQLLFAVWLHNYEEQRRTYATENARLRTAPAVITGDSIAHFFTPDRLQKYVTSMPVLNRGIAGDSTPTLANRLDADVLALNPEYVIISIGGNDLIQGRCLPDALRETRNIIQRAKRNGKSRVILVSVPPVIMWKANAIVPYYNWQLLYLTQEINGVTYLDLWPELSRTDTPGLRPEFHQHLPDGTLDRAHFNEQGYAIFGRLLDNLLQ
ncbi:MAG: hypothetical protein KDK30_09550 [Leptospiraceae bacterium]|nr:hypothetical protein [Leptospiraceae bacterium]MCB1316396.1 hypothetical protein [Leptospiraceae bacterium]MCB1318775.1 hypothetical protein [Leptospiraceae bacterium]